MDASGIVGSPERKKPRTQRIIESTVSFSTELTPRSSKNPSKNTKLISSKKRSPRCPRTSSPKHDVYEPSTIQSYDLSRAKRLRRTRSSPNSSNPACPPSLSFPLERSKERAGKFGQRARDIGRTLERDVSCKGVREPHCDNSTRSINNRLRPLKRPFHSSPAARPPLIGRS